MTEDKKLSVMNVTKQYMNNTKVARVISTKAPAVDSDGKTIRVAINKEESVFNLVDLYMDPNLSFSHKIVPFDLAVMDAVYTILCNGEDVFSAEQIACVFTGNEKHRATSKLLQEIQESVDKLRIISIRINCTEEVNTRRDLKKYKDKVEYLVHESYLLPVEKIELKYRANGKMIRAYHLIKKPALYTYAEMLHQIVDVTAETLNPTEKGNDTRDAVLIKRYVVKRIEQIKHRKKTKSNLRSDDLSYLWLDAKGEPRGLYAELGFLPDMKGKNWRTKIKPRIHKIVCSVLESLKERGSISGYEVYREGKTNNPAMPIQGFHIYV